MTVSAGTHIVEVAGGAPGTASGPPLISAHYGNVAAWPGDTFGISTMPGNRHRVMLSWGSAVGRSANSEIFAVPVPVSG